MKNRPYATLFAAMLTAGWSLPQEGRAMVVDTEAPTDTTEAMRSLDRDLEALEEKMTTLAEAMPAMTYGWRPMMGVRSVGEVYAHTAADNWFVARLVGHEVPAWTGISDHPDSVETYEQRARRASKEDLLNARRESFDTLRAALGASMDDPERSLDLSGQSVTAVDLWIRAITHLHEHLGQSIAYARMNSIVPPWSR